MWYVRPLCITRPVWLKLSKWDWEGGHCGPVTPARGWVPLIPGSEAPTSLWVRMVPGSGDQLRAGAMMAAICMATVPSPQEVCIWRLRRELASRSSLRGSGEAGENTLIPERARSHGTSNDGGVEGEENNRCVELEEIILERGSRIWHFFCCF